MIPLTLETKIIAIMLLALMNVLLLRRKKNDKDYVETYVLSGQQPHNINNNDKNDQTDSMNVIYEYTEKFVD